MFRHLTATCAVAVLTGAACAAQSSPTPERHGPQPIYRVTIVSRTAKAISYNRGIPTRIDFGGTALLPGARGGATVDNRRGSTVVEARFDHIDPPTRFGPQYLTYVLWAISPEGRAQNLGELVANGSGKARLTASTTMQTFALIVTAEPHYSVAQPSDVVVMENAVRSDTIGKVQEVDAAYELLPRKDYTYDKQLAAKSSPAGKPLPMDEYEAVVAIYQAENAIHIAEAQGALKYDPERIRRARQLVTQARGYPKGLSKDIVANAREATQLAEDARAITAKRAEEAHTTADRAMAPVGPDPARETAVGEIQRAREAADRAAAEADRAARAAAAAQVPPPEPPPTEVQPNPPIRTMPARTENTSAKDNRRNLTVRLNSIVTTIDTPRGVVVTIPESMIGSAPMPERMSRIAQEIRSYPGVRISVEGYTDRTGQDASTIAQGYADSVRNALLRAGLSANQIQSRGLAGARQVASNATEAGREQNRRVEIVITGDAIGSAPVWDRSYSLLPSRR